MCESAPGPSAGSVAKAAQLQGKPLSYNNLVDAQAALALIMDFFPRPADGASKAAAGDARAVVPEPPPKSIEQIPAGSATQLSVSKSHIAVLGSQIPFRHG